LKAHSAIDTKGGRERAILVGVASGDLHRSTLQEYLAELTLLTESAGALVAGTITQERDRPDPAFYIGKGKAEELAWLVEERNAQLVVFDDDLSPVQARNLERLVARKIIDRSAIILDIFASRARTSEAKVQVELAQLQYMLPRLTRQWTHLSKQYGGIGTKGPGETQIETDRRALRERISRLRTRLRGIAKEREVQRKGREKFPRVALVGYTNAGKSTLLNWLSGAGVLVEDRLFATVDSTVRLVTLKGGRRILLSDTVGFIRKLPHHLVASFHSTLDEVREADVLLHVVDAAHPYYADQIRVVNETLEEIGAHGKPTLLVFNKIDLLGRRNLLARLREAHPSAVCISATRSINMSGLLRSMMHMLAAGVTMHTMTFRPDQYDLVSYIHDVAEVIEQQYDEDGVTIRFRTDASNAARLKKRLAARTEAHIVSAPAKARK
jgi:GTP-binding protein HflX